MSLATGTGKMTADEFLARDDWPRFSQLIEGEVVVNEPLLPHQRGQGVIFRALCDWAEAGPGRGEVGLPTDVQVTDFSVYAPDVWWMSEARMPGPDDLRITGVPDLAVEVRSESTWRFDRGVKLRRYEQAGVAEVWLVDTVARSVIAHRRSSPASPTFDIALEIPSGQVLTSPMLPGFSLPVARIFTR